MNGSLYRLIMVGWMDWIDVWIGEHIMAVMRGNASLPWARLLVLGRECVTVPELFAVQTFVLLRVILKRTYVCYRSPHVYLTIQSELDDDSELWIRYLFHQRFLENKNHRHEFQYNKLVRPQGNKVDPKDTLVRLSHEWSRSGDRDVSTASC